MKFHFTSTIGTHYAKTKDDARDEFIQWGFAHQLELRKRYPPEKIVKSQMPANQRDTIIFTVDDLVIETWNLRATWGIMDGIKKLMRMK